MLVMAAVIIGIVVQFQLSTSRRRDVALFCLTILLVGIPAYFGFLKTLGYLTQPWYYLPLMALVAAAVDGAPSALPWAGWRESGRTLFALAIALWSFLPTWSAMHVRQTNVDMVAAKLEKDAGNEDLIVVAPWYFGITFEKYYRGSAQWMTLPSIDDHKIHRYDLLKERMTAVDPLGPVFNAMGNALKSGHRVWIVGSISFPKPGETPKVFAPAPFDPAGWSEDAYTRTWSVQAGYFVQTHAGTAETFGPIGNQPIDPYEDAQIMEVRGWQGR
jgi:hypothetical protein